jgi:hypothetical protein
VASEFLTPAPSSRSMLSHNVIIGAAFIVYYFQAGAICRTTVAEFARIQMIVGSGTEFLRIQLPFSRMTRTVADLCREHHLDVAELSRRSGLEEGRVLAIALGRWTPTPSERQKIAAVFELTPDNITWGHATPIQHLYGPGPG